MVLQSVQMKLKKANKNKEIKFKILKTIAAGDNPKIKKYQKILVLK